jgi:hypothetical protein
LPAVELAEMAALPSACRVPDVGAGPGCPAPRLGAATSCNKSFPPGSWSIACAENLCHQAIFMNHASGAVAPPDPEVVQVGDVIWQRAERGGLVQGAMRPMGVVEVLVLAQDSPQVALVPCQGLVQQLTRQGRSSVP